MFQKFNIAILYKTASTISNVLHDVSQKKKQSFEISLFKKFIQLSTFFFVSSASFLNSMATSNWSYLTNEILSSRKKVDDANYKSSYREKSDSEDTDEDKDEKTETYKKHPGILEEQVIFLRKNFV